MDQSRTGAVMNRYVSGQCTIGKNSTKKKAHPATIISRRVTLKVTVFKNGSRQIGRCSAAIIRLVSQEQAIHHRPAGV